MSLGYAEKLSYKEDTGTVGMTESFDSPQTLQEKVGLFIHLFIFFMFLIMGLFCIFNLVQNL